MGLNPSKPESVDITDAEAIAQAAMSSPLTIGLEQIVVSAGLLLISLFVLSRSGKRHDFVSFLNDLFHRYLNPFKSSTNATKRGKKRSGSMSISNSGSRKSLALDGDEDENNEDENHLLASSTMNISNSANIETSGKKNTSSNNSRTNATGTLAERLRQSRSLPNSSIRKSKSTPFITITEPLDADNDCDVSDDYDDDENSQQEMNLPSEVATTLFLGSSFCTGFLRSRPSTPQHEDANEHVDGNDGIGVEGEEGVFTEYERFVRAYSSHIRTSEYRRLVLPPSCQLLDPSKIPTEVKGNRNGMGQDGQDEGWLYFLLDIVHKIISFDYIGYTLHFNYRIWKACQFRICKILGYKVLEEEDGEEEEDGDPDVDDASHASRDGSVMSSRSLLSRDSVLNYGVPLRRNSATSSSVYQSATTSSVPLSPKRDIFSSKSTTVNANFNAVNLATIRQQPLDNSLSGKGDVTATGLQLSFSESADDSALHNNLQQDGKRERFYTGEVFSSNADTRMPTSLSHKLAGGMNELFSTSFGNGHADENVLSPKLTHGSKVPSDTAASTTNDYFDVSLHSLGTESASDNWDPVQDHDSGGNVNFGDAINAGIESMRGDENDISETQDRQHLQQQHLPPVMSYQRSPSLSPTRHRQEEKKDSCTFYSPLRHIDDIGQIELKEESQDLGSKHDGQSRCDHVATDVLQSFESIGQNGGGGGGDNPKHNCVKKKKAFEQLSMPTLRSSTSGGKQKDFLEKFRSKGMGSTIAAHKSAPSNPISATMKNSSSVPFSSEIKISQTSGIKSAVRAQQQELSYFDTATNTQSIKKLERASPLPDREGYILGDQFLEDPRDTPLLVFVNTRSGSQQGPMLKSQLRSLLNPIQVWDLADGGPEKIIRSFSVLTRLRLLVCGGDGTVSWIISALDKMCLDRWPPIAILPLGTGNDLARIHGWGAGYANESLLLILNQVQESYISLLDRWTLKIEEKKRKGKIRKKKVMKPFINYMSIGMDAVSALQVHNLRENSPNMFFSRAVNKVWYALFGAEEAIKASCSNLPQQIVLEADGVEVPIPPDSQGLIFLNIDSYLGGVPLWSRGVPLYKTKPRRRRERRHSEGDFLGMSDSIAMGRRRAGSYDENESVIDDNSSVMWEEENEESLEDKHERIVACKTPSSCQDGRLDVISHRGNFHLGQIRVGLSYGQRLCQCTKVRIKMKNGLAVQLDGEPWKQDKGVLTVERQKDPAIMLHRALEEGGGIETEVANLLEWAEEKKIIKRDAHATLMKEFSRRIEKKTRARRNRSQQTVFSTMKRRIASANRLATS